MVPVIRPSVRSSWASACSWVSFSFLTSLADLALGDLACLLEALVDEFLFDVLEQDGDVGGGDDLGDLSAHHPGAHDSCFEDEHGGILSREPHRREPGQRGHAEGRSDAPDADRVQLADLDPGQPGGEAEAREREHRGERPGPLAVTGERGQDREVAEQAQQRDRHAREVRVGRLLDRGAAVGDRAHRLAAGVVDDGEVARDAEARRGRPRPRRRAASSECRLELRVAEDAGADHARLRRRALATVKVGVAFTPSRVASLSARSSRRMRELAVGRGQRLAGVDAGGL